MEKFDKLATIGVLGCAAIVTLTAVHRTFATAPSSGQNARTLEHIEAWEDAIPISTRVAGNETAPIRVIVFVDLQCPVCRAFHGMVRDLINARPNDAQLLYVHYPLSYHEAALPAAQVAECARQSGEFDSLVDAVFNNQDSLGIKSWESYASDAGIDNPASIAACAENRPILPRVAAGIDIGKRFQLRGTPTVIIEGWRYPETPQPQYVDEAISALLNGGTPEY